MSYRKSMAADSTADILKEFLLNCGETNKGRQLIFGLADAPSGRYSVVAALHEVRRCGKNKLKRVLVIRILFYAFDGNQIIDTPISQCMMLCTGGASRYSVARAVVSFCYLLSVGTPPQEFRDSEFDISDVIAWETQ